ncbi:type II secretion system secretin GspD [Yunchengibacter salinarum]|uniref:type II secretion system secretin GspD n=1 Tax=Yunchengibacter salinarum TaxID=3133399 RepID=UPI0035B5B65A
MTRPSTWLIVSLALLALIGAGLSPLSAPGAHAQDSRATDNSERLNFRDADIRAFIDDVAMVTQRTFIIDPRVTGKVTVISESPIPAENLFDLFLSTLRVYGFTAVATANGAYKIVPEEAAMQDRTALTSGDDRLVTEVFRLSHINPVTALNAVKPIVNRQARTFAERTGNFLMVVDYAGNMGRIRDLLTRLDQDRRKTRLITLENVGAEDMAETLADMRGPAQGDSPDPGLTVVPVTSSNTILLKGDEALLAEIVPLVRELDSRGAAKGDIRVHTLRHADAGDMVTMLEAVSRSLSDTTGEGGGQRRASISAHPETNSVVISANPATQKTLESVIRQLDIPRAQVLVEAIIVEVSDNAARELGLQYVLAGGDGSNIPFTVTNFSNTAPNILAATGAIALDDELDADAGNALRQGAIDSFLGLNGFSAGFAGETSGGTLFGVILNALDSDVASNILSTPSVMTLDNQEASIIVGQEIPITTGEALGTNNSNPFRTVDRQDVGIQLEVLPQINEGDGIRLFIRQEVSSISGTAGASNSEIITNKREIETTVNVENGEILVLGGLIEQDERITVDKVPLLGDIPGLGRLFRSEGRSSQKTNLMVFIRPTIVRSRADMRAVTGRKYDLMRREQRRRLDTDGPATIDRLMNDVIGRKGEAAAPPPAPTTDSDGEPDR